MGIRTVHRPILTSSAQTLAWLSLLILISTQLFIPSTSTAAIQVEDLVSPFIQGIHKLKSKKPQDLKLYVLEFEFLHGKEYSATYYNNWSQERRERTLRGLDDYSKKLLQRIPLYEKKLTEISSIIDRVSNRFKEIFDQEVDAKVYLFSALATTDANALGLDGGKAFSLNLRLVADYTKEELEIVIAHELFHLLQAKLMTSEPEGGKIESALFSEGWATFASSLVFPGYPDWKYISYFKKNDAQFKGFERDRNDVITSIVRDWESKDDTVPRKYFSGDTKDSSPWEPRSGYYLGYLAAKSLAQKKSAKDVVLMKFTEFRRVIHSTLESLRR